MLFFALTVACIVALADEHLLVGQAPKDKAKEPPKSTAKLSAAELTRTKLLKTKVTGSFQEVRLGDILKELGDQVDMKGEQPVMWAYGKGFPYTQKVSLDFTDKPLDVVLDLLLKKAGDSLGYVVVSKEGDKYDGWVRLTTGGERGAEKDAPTAQEEATAAEKLTLAKKLIDLGKPTAAKPVLEILVKNYPNTKAGIEAKELLEKINK
jgi:hypothetical protein